MTKNSEYINDGNADYILISYGKNRNLRRYRYDVSITQRPRKTGRNTWHGFITVDSPLIRYLNDEERHELAESACHTTNDKIRIIEPTKAEYIPNADFSVSLGLEYFFTENTFLQACQRMIIFQNNLEAIFSDCAVESPKLTLGYRDIYDDDEYKEMLSIYNLDKLYISIDKTKILKKQNNAQKL